MNGGIYMSYIAGVDIGGTNTKIGIVTEEGEILVKKVLKLFL